MTVFVCGGCGQELTEPKPDFYKCSKCGVEIDDRNQHLAREVAN